ncbi:hypothetical protein F5884DRAFT_660886 [Xylogone sp. PMI_703]|nr:hypothetical protein F5884DRAFT_660886 [Xylogone sp. PMI_703]
MLAVYAERGDFDNPLSALRVGQRPVPTPPEGWVKVKISAAAVNYHDIFTLKGVGPYPIEFPRILGCEGCGTLEDGTEVMLYPVITDKDYRGVETLDPKRHVFQELIDGALAEYVISPALNVIPRPKELPVNTAAVLGIAWLTAYRMLFNKSGLRPGQTMLVQGCSGGVATALIQLGVAAGMQVWCTGRSEEKRKLAEELGAARTFPPGHKLPEFVDAVFDVSGAATWEHSIASVKPGGTVLNCGGHGGFTVPTDLGRVFVEQITIRGSYAGTLDELKDLISFVVQKKIAPKIGLVLPLSEAEKALKAMHDGATNGKIVLTA